MPEAVPLLTAASSDGWGGLLHLLLLLTGCLLLGALAERLRQHALVGYLLAGTLLGPHGLAVVPESAEVELLAELGVALLLFAIGLEFSIERFRALGRPALVGGSLQVLATAAVGTVIGLALGLPLPAAAALGLVMAPSSTAVVMRMLGARAELESPPGRAAVGVLLFQDAAIVPLVLAIEMLKGDGGVAASLFALARTLALAALLVGALLLLLRHVLPLLLGSRALRSNRDLPVLLAVGVGLGATWTAHTAGLSPALGAFIAGVVLGESPFATQVRADVGALRALLVALFFGSIGMLGDPAWVMGHLPEVLGVVAAVVVGKALLAAAALRLAGIGLASAVAAGACLAQIGEFSFVLAEVARDGLLGERAFHLVVSATIVSLFLTPSLIAAAPALARRLTGRAGPPTGAGPAGDAKRVLVVGLGPAGQAVTAALAAAGDEVHVLDLNPSAVGLAQRLGAAGHLGDARQAEVLGHLELASFQVIVVTVPDPRNAAETVSLARALAPGIRIVARARYHLHRDSIAAAGAEVVVDEERAVGELLAERAAEILVGTPADQAAD
ncbi:MAG: cation:proton antiporter [Planctomycetes bacterium]|nr:cation:proton antiporter [Planctomycetota bacterium]MBL7008104.1 cation:proton antiporter [Planctomycetota bacterium]